MFLLKRIARIAPYAILSLRDVFVQTGTPKTFCCKDGGSRVKLSPWPFCARIPGPTDTIWASFED